MRLRVVPRAKRSALGLWTELNEHSSIAEPRLSVLSGSEVPHTVKGVRHMGVPQAGCAKVAVLLAAITAPHRGVRFIAQTAHKVRWRADMFDDAVRIFGGRLVLGKRSQSLNVCLHICEYE